MKIIIPNRKIAKKNKKITEKLLTNALNYVKVIER